MGMPVIITRFLPSISKTSSSWQVLLMNWIMVTVSAPDLSKVSQIHFDGDGDGLSSPVLLRRQVSSAQTMNRRHCRATWLVLILDSHLIVHGTCCVCARMCLCSILLVAVDFFGTLELDKTLFIH